MFAIVGCAEPGVLQRSDAVERTSGHGSFTRLASHGKLGIQYASKVGSQIRTAQRFTPVLAGLWQQRRRDLWTLWIAIVSAGIAVGALVVSIVTAATA